MSDQVEEHSHPGKSLNSSIVKPMVNLTSEISGKKDSDSESGLLGSDSDSESGLLGSDSDSESRLLGSNSDSESYSDSRSGKQSNDSDSDPW